MSALPPETGLGYTPPVVRQLSVFLENKVGRLHDMLEVFQREPGLELCALSVLEASEHSVVRLIPTNAKLASDLLKEDGWAFTATDLLVVRLQPGQTIEGLCLALLSVELNLRFAYPLLAGESMKPRWRSVLMTTCLLDRFCDEEGSTCLAKPT